MARAPGRSKPCTSISASAHICQSESRHTFQSTGTDKVGAYLKREEAAEHKAVEARLWEKLVQMFASGKVFCRSDISQDAELTEQFRLVTKEWLLYAIDMSDLPAKQA